MPRKEAERVEEIVVFGIEVVAQIVWPMLMLKENACGEQPHWDDSQRQLGAGSAYIQTRD
jgi:hypothetical protein